MTRVKICGITNLGDALMCAKFSADAIGFNFYEKSKRYVSPNEARSIIQHMDRRIHMFGVFVNASLDKILDTVRTTGINVIQLHGTESPDFAFKVRTATGLETIKAVRVSEAFELSAVSEYEVDAILLDSYAANEFGGTGVRFDWNKAVSPAEIRLPIYLAGGLIPENVAEAIRVVRPFAVDVASGVESRPGRKDPTRLEAFIKNAKQA